MLRITAGLAVGLFSFSGLREIKVERAEVSAIFGGMFTHGIYENANCECTHTMQAQASQLAMYE